MLTSKSYRVIKEGNVKKDCSIRTRYILYQAWNCNSKEQWENNEFILTTEQDCIDCSCGGSMCMEGWHFSYGTLEEIKQRYPDLLKDIEPWW